MKLTGVVVELDVDLDEHDFVVREAVLTPKKLAIDWVEDGQTLSLIAHSKDGGLTYKGKYGSPVPDEFCTMEVTRFNARDGRILLLAKWYETDTGNAGSSMFLVKGE